MSSILEDTNDKELESVMEVEEVAEASELDLDAVVEAANPEADFNIPPPPPTAGVYPFRWKLQDKKASKKSENQHPSCYVSSSPKVGAFINLFITGEMIAEDTLYNGYQLNDYMNSLVDRRKGTSKIHYFLYNLGVNVPSRITLRELMQLCIDTIENNPVGQAEVEWRASRPRTEEEMKSAKNPEDKYIELKSRMSQFPKIMEDGKWTGEYQNWIEVDGVKYYASAYIYKHVGNV